MALSHTGKRAKCGKDIQPIAVVAMLAPRLVVCFTAHDSAIASGTIGSHWIEKVIDNDSCHEWHCRTPENEPNAGKDIQPIAMAAMLAPRLVVCITADSTASFVPATFSLGDSVP